MFLIKRLPDGSIDRFKAWFVLRAFIDDLEFIFQETYSPVIKPAMIRLALGLAVSWHWDLRQLDVNNAFLQGTLNEDVYMQQPAGFVDRDNPNHIFKFHKSFYGLKQSQCAWYMELRTFL